MTGWYVVKFTKEKNLIEVIPSNWIHNLKKCLWPEKLGTLKLQAAIKNRSRPSDDWKLHPIKVLSKQMYSNYSDASKCADKTLALTSSASETELTQNQSINKRKRTCKADNYNGLSSSSDEEQSTAHNIPDFPNFTSKISVFQEIDGDIVEEGTKSNIYNNNYHNQDSFVNNTNSLIEQPDNLTVCQSEENEDLLLQELEAVTDVQDENSLSVHNEYPKKQKSSDNQPATPSSMLEFEPIYETLPVTNEESLNLLQQALTNDQTLFNKTVKMLSLIGGSDIKESVRRILRKLISNDYAKQFSYTGHKSSKHAFNKTILSSLLIKAIHSTSNLADRSVKELEAITSIWLSKASERAKNNN
ncbi:unnamed protein product [Macrosiphum euphorbiae]|uniref:DUF4806 domain-containing protein n=1 Tax=Macrosiphum euphorbiae TaxID=13131 RepID=A0AAV0XQA6_9HEMI|nr:unnamed protein product [Macrosiphum euphorbiae]